MRKFLQKIALFGVCSLLMTPAFAATFYLSPDGNDARDGISTATAWRTLERASRQKLGAGDQILLRGGAQFSGSLRFDGAGVGGNAQNPIVLGSWGEGRAVIESEKSAVELRSLPGIIVRDLVVRGVSKRGPMKREHSGVLLLNDLDGARKLGFVRVQNVEASGFGDAGIAVLTRNADGSKSGFEDVEISDCVAHDNVFNGILVDGTWDEKATTYSHQNVSVRDCRAFRNLGDPEFLENWSGNGIFIADIDGALIESCQAWENGANCNATVGGPVGIWAASANNVTIQNCHSHHNRTGRGLDGGGFDLDGGVTNSVMQFNLSHDNDGAGFLLYAYANAPHRFANNALRFCISRNDGRKNGYGSLTVGHHGNKLGVKNLEIYGNIFENSPAPEGKKPPVIRIFTEAEIHLENNLFFARGVPFIEADKTQSSLRESENIWRGEGETGFLVGGKPVANLAAVRAK